MKPLAKGNLGRKQLETLWMELACDDAARARRALWKLVAAPQQSVPFLAQQFRAVPAPDPKALARLIAGLDARRLRVRERARLELEKLSQEAGPALRQALANPASLEQARRLERLVAKLAPPYKSGPWLRRLRAIEALERIGSADACKLLRQVADRKPAMPEAEDAKASLQRLAKKKPAKKP